MRKTHLLIMTLLAYATLLDSRPMQALSSVAKPDFSRFNKVQVWTGQVTVNIQFNGQVYLNPDLNTSMGKLNQNLSKTLGLTGQLMIENALSITPTWGTEFPGGQIGGNAKIDILNSSTIPNIMTGVYETRQTTTKGGGGVSRNPDAPDFGAISLSINPDDGIYSMSGSMGVPVKIHNQYTGEDSEENQDVTGSSQEMPLPKTGLELSGSRRFIYNDSSLVPDGKAQEAAKTPQQPGVPFDPNQIQKQLSPLSPQPIFGMVTWSFTPGVKLESNLIIEPAEPGKYDKWLPTPPEAGKGGETLSFKASYTPKKGQKQATPGRIDFYLRDVSRHKGWCTNFPKNKPAKDDLEFAPQAEQAAGIIVDSPNHLHTKEKVLQALVTVKAKDTGAYGQIAAVAEDQSEASYEKTKEHFIRIPADQNHNSIADQWEKDNQVFSQNLAATWDEDPEPAGQRRNGDGYTLYEEYRGFMTNNSYKRTNPLKKDLFVYDENGMVRKYYETAGSNPAGVTLEYINPTMMEFTRDLRKSGNRWVNLNSEAKDQYARQFALYVAKSYDIEEDGTVGKSMSLQEYNFEERKLKDINTVLTTEDYFGAFAQPLKYYYLVRIIEEGSDHLLERLVQMHKISATYAKKLKPFFDQDLKVTVQHEIGHAIGIRHHTLNFKKDATPETPADTYSGDRSCIMRYTEPQTDYEDHQDASGNLIPAIKPTGYCRGPNNCWHQIDIKSDP